MVTMGVFPFQGKTHMVEPGIEPGTSWLVVRSSDHQATRAGPFRNHKLSKNLYIKKKIRSIVKEVVMSQGKLLVAVPD